MHHLCQIKYTLCFTPFLLTRAHTCEITVLLGFNTVSTLFQLCGGKRLLINDPWVNIVLGPRSRSLYRDHRDLGLNPVTNPRR